MSVTASMQVTDCVYNAAALNVFTHRWCFPVGGLWQRLQMQQRHLEGAAPSEGRTPGVGPPGQWRPPGPGLPHKRPRKLAGHPASVVASYCMWPA